jgi:hypothetical protein
MLPVPRRALLSEKEAEADVAILIVPFTITEPCLNKSEYG